MPALSTNLPYSYSFDAYFISSDFDVQLLNRVIPVTENIYNRLPRKNGHRKQINVMANRFKKCLEFTLYSDILINPINQLRASQYFSKVLSEQQGMDSYIVNGRVLTSNYKNGWPLPVFMVKEKCIFSRDVKKVHNPIHLFGGVFEEKSFPKLQIIFYWRRA